MYVTRRRKPYSFLSKIKEDLFEWQITKLK
nr:MAG TPA: hypothetical protein [Caudoviricetes sp.]